MTPRRGVPCGGICDFGVVQLQVDDNNPITNDPFETISGRYEDLQPNYYQTTVSLPDSVSVAGNTIPLAGHTIHLRFHFQSDTNVQEPHTGWWIDDINVSGEPPSEGPTSVKVSSFTANAARGAVVIRWRTATEINTLGFNVWRFSHGKGVKLNRTVIAAKGRTRGGAYSLLDRQARPGVAYTYRLQLVGKDGRRAWAARTAVRVKR